MLRFSCVIVFLLSPVFVLADVATDPRPLPSALSSVQGVVADSTGAIVPNAEVSLMDTNGSIAGTSHSGDDGNFTVPAPHAGNFTLVVS